jgi:hypothetical protein
MLEHALAMTAIFKCILPQLARIRA